MRIMTLALLLATYAGAADTPAVKASIKPEKERPTAPDFSLIDGSGKPVKLSDYRGKVVLLNFWATWCHGCKVEIPWFVDFEKSYAPEGFAVLGISMDEGWAPVKQYVENTGVPYRMLLGNDSTAQRYKIETMPDTFIIDREGRIAAAYAGLVDKSDIEANIKTVLTTSATRVPQTSGPRR